MSHHPGCPKNQSLYADCECERIELRQNTEAMDRLRETRVDEIEDLKRQLSEAKFSADRWCAKWRDETDALRVLLAEVGQRAQSELECRVANQDAVRKLEREIAELRPDALRYRAILSDTSETMKRALVDWANDPLAPRAELDAAIDWCREQAEVQASKRISTFDADDAMCGVPLEPRE